MAGVSAGMGHRDRPRSGAVVGVGSVAAGRTFRVGQGVTAGRPITGAAGGSGAALLLVPDPEANQRDQCDNENDLQSAHAANPKQRRTRWQSPSARFRQVSSRLLDGAKRDLSGG